MAFVRNSGVVRCYINGVQLSNTYSNSSQMGALGSNIINVNWDGAFTNFANAPLIDNVVFAKTALYTSNFTPPTQPITNQIGFVPTITNSVYGAYQNY